MIETLLAAVIGFSISSFGLQDNNKELTERELLVKIADDIKSNIKLGPRSKFCDCEEAHSVNARVSNEDIIVSLDKSTSEESYNEEIKRKVENGIRKYLNEVHRIYGTKMNFTIPIVIYDEWAT